jgi:hypothetical protein
VPRSPIVRQVSSRVASPAGNSSVRTVGRPKRLSRNVRARRDLRIRRLVSVSDVRTVLVYDFCSGSKGDLRSR